MISVRSYGNQIRCGVYALHSIFASAANFISGGKFAFVVDSRIGAGPLNIVIEGMPIESLRHLDITNDRFYFNGNQILSDTSKMFDANIHIDSIDRTRFIHNLPLIKDEFILHSPPKSLAFLIDPARITEFSSSFELAFVDKIRDGINLLLNDEYERGTEKLKGVGYGLTPSGDDFISGFLIALNVCRKFSGRDLSNIISTIHCAARSDNGFTNAFLDCAADGQVSEIFQKLIHALGSPVKTDISACTRTLLTVGATSGTDQAVGFLIGIKRFIQ